MKGNLYETSAPKISPAALVLLTPKEAARLLKVSISFLAKKRLTGDGPSYIKVGRSIRYTEVALLAWMNARQRQSTSQSF
jgi:hypothetical protein